MSLQIIEGKPGEDENKDEVPGKAGSSVTNKKHRVKGKQHSYDVFIPMGQKGEEIMRYLTGPTKEGVEIDSLFGEGKTGFQKLCTDTDKNLNFTIEKRGKDYYITLRGRR